MRFVTHIHVLAAAFLIGVAAAAPIGPVNMMAIRRGVLGGERHTLACGAGAVLGDLLLFSLALLGGQYLVLQQSNPTLRLVLAALGLVILLPAGIYFLVLAVSDQQNAFKRAHRRWAESSIPAHLIGEAGKAFVLTVFNPLAAVYWIAITSSWMPLAVPVLGSRAPALGAAMAALGMMSWFAVLALLVYFIPRRISAVFFRLVNAVLGLILVGFASYCAKTLLVKPR